jgi:hypothetical protein
MMHQKAGTDRCRYSAGNEIPQRGASEQFRDALRLSNQVAATSRAGPSICSAARSPDSIIGNQRAR